MNLIFFVQIMAVVQHSMCTVPGAFFWKPRTELDLRAGETSGSALKVYYPTVRNIELGKVVLINGFKLGTSMMAIAAVGVPARGSKFPQYDLTHGDFYTNAYRWSLRAISMITEWLASSSNYAASHKVWFKRFHYVDKQVPDWLKSLLFFVDGWDDEKKMWKRYKLYAMPSFDKHQRFPSPRTDADPYDFNSFRQTEETVENLDDSEAETPPPRSFNWGPFTDWLYDEGWHG